MIDPGLENLGLGPVPEFGAGVARVARTCGPRELFRALFVDLEGHVGHLEPAFGLALSLLRRAPLPPGSASDTPAFLDALLGWAGRELGGAPEGPAGEAGLRQVALEFGPSGLSDGAWLTGSVLANTVETEVGMRQLQQLMLRFGDPGSSEPHARRYAAFLLSLGHSPDVVTAGDEADPIADISFEHALLGLSLGLFPSTLEPEALGYNLWQASFGPCPLLSANVARLEAMGACVRYFRVDERALLGDLARQAVEQALAAADGAALRPRIARGFAAAHTSYQRWERAVLALSDPNAGRSPRPEALPAVELAGRYGAAQDEASLRGFAFARYGALSHAELYHCLANSDQHPGLRLFGRAFVESVLVKLNHALDMDSRLNADHPPAYSERMLAELVAAQHEKNVRSRIDFKPPDGSIPALKKLVGAIFDGCWLQGFADLHRAHLEEYGWLFRIYASEHGDGRMAWNHSRIFRLAFAELGEDIFLPKTDARLYRVFDVGAGSVAKFALALNTRRFMPEILGMNLGIEASGVGGEYIENWKRARGEGARWKALVARLHNSIDNYADGHTKWSLAAVQAFLRRVQESAPAELEPTWRRVWRQWRLQDILTHGTPSERAALAEHFDLTSMALA